MEKLNLLDHLPPMGVKKGIIQYALESGLGKHIWWTVERRINEVKEDCYLVHDYSGMGSTGGGSIQKSYSTREEAEAALEAIESAPAFLVHVVADDWPFIDGESLGMSDAALGRSMVLQWVVGDLVKGNPAQARTLRETLESHDRLSNHFPPTTSDNIRNLLQWFISLADAKNSTEA